MMADTKEKIIIGMDRKCFGTLDIVRRGKEKLVVLEFEVLGRRLIIEFRENDFIDFMREADACANNLYNDQQHHFGAC